MDQQEDPSNDLSQRSVREELQKAVGDLWSSIVDLGDDYVIFVDRRKLHTQVRRTEAGLFAVTWEQDDGSEIGYEVDFENPREAAFHAYQGPH